MKKNIIKKSKIIYRICSIFYLSFQWLYYRTFLFFFSIFKIDNKKVMIISYYGKGYGDSGKYIADELLKTKEIKVYWAGDDNNRNTIPEPVNYVKYNSIKYLFHLATSKFWINNTRFRYGIIKRKNQYYIQVWHGGLALKKVEYDVLDDLSYVYQKAMASDNKMIDLMVSNSSFCSNMYKNAFKYNGKILEVGTPRNDILISNKNNKLKDKIISYCNLNSDNNLLLYAPTFRNNYEENPYDIDFNKVKMILDNMTNSNWKILIRLHPNIKSTNLITYTDDCFDVTNYPDMQELIASCDLLITDYSSTMFESLIADKPVILYAKDINNYKKSRGYYFDLEKLPFLLAKNNSDLEEILRNNNLQTLKNNYLQFTREVSLKETGKASQKIAKIIVKGGMK